MQSNNLYFEKGILNIIKEHLGIQGIFGFGNNYQKDDICFLMQQVGLNQEGQTELIQNNINNTFKVKQNNNYNCKIEIIGNGAKYLNQKLKTMWSLPSIIEKCSSLGISYIKCLNSIDLSELLESNYVQRIISNHCFYVSFEEIERFSEIKEINMNLNNNKIKVKING